jgi:DNA-binding CsgD family transcriptional regulator
MIARSSAFKRQIRSAVAAIDEVDGSREAQAEAPLAAIAQLLRLENALSYSLRIVDGRPRVDAGNGYGLAAFVDRLDGYLARAPVRFGSYDPVRPEARQRNRALRLHELGPAAPSAVVRDLYPAYGLLEKPQLRVLVCEGPALLGWVGGWRADEFSDAEAVALQSLVAPLRRRLKLTAWAGRDGFHFGAVQVVMEAIGAPAFLTRIDGLPVHVNQSARVALQADESAVRERLSRAARGEEPSLQVSPIRAPGVPTHLLIVLPASASDLHLRLASVAKAWSLTPRQAEVLPLVVRGEANKVIAATLGCSVRTIEVHLTALLEKSQCESRAELGARFWQTRA